MTGPALPFDSIIIGGGHNGLACAAYLGRAGQRVAVIEAREILGGFTTSEHPFSNHPDVTVPMASMDLATANLPPSIIDGLNMRAHGLQLIDVDPFYSYVAADGTSLVFWRDIERTCAEIARLSSADAAAYRRFTQDMTAFWCALAPYMHAHPTRPGPRALASMLLRAGRTPRRLARAARIMLMSPKSVIESTFQTPALQAAFANFAAASTAPLDQPGSGIILAVMAMQHEWGVARPVGGMGAFADTLAAIGAQHQVTFLTGSGVAEIIVEQGRAIGVALANGARIHAKNIIGALDPKTLMQRLLPGAAMPAGLAAELAGMTAYSTNIASARLDLLLQKKPGMVVDAARADVLLPTSMLIGPETLAGVQRYVAACGSGVLGDDIPLWAASPSMLDRSLTPTAEQQSLYVYVPAVPYKFADGTCWSDRRDELGEKIVNQLERVMPGLRSLILARAVRTPEDIQKTSGLERGCAYHVDMSLAQMGPWRPTPSLAGYRTPVPGLWHTGAGAHPMGSVNGISGKLAAETVLRARAA
jgi:beta-carotene ketolase (CrtO type)